MELSDEEYQTLVGQLLYGLLSAPELGEEAVHKFADGIVSHQFFRRGTALYRAALSRAVQSAEPVDPNVIQSRFDDLQLREFFGRLAQELDRRQPWPPPKFVKLSPLDWPGLASAPSAARIRADVQDAQAHTWLDFDTVEVAGKRTPVLVFRLRSGEVAALVGSDSPDLREHRWMRMVVLEGDPAAALASFVELSGINEERVVASTP